MAGEFVIRRRGKDVPEPARPRGSSDGVNALCRSPGER